MTISSAAVDVTNYTLITNCNPFLLMWCVMSLTWICWRENKRAWWWTVKESCFRGTVYTVNAQDEHLGSGCCINVEGEVAETLHKMQQVLNYRKEILVQRVLQRSMCFCQQPACYFCTTGGILRVKNRRSINDIGG